MTTEEIHKLPYKAQLYINELQRKIKDLLKIKKQIIMDKCKWNVKILIGLLLISIFTSCEDTYWECYTEKQTNLYTGEITYTEVCYEINTN